MILLAPVLLLGLLALPLLWWLLRALPPAPRSQSFPPLFLLLGLRSRVREARRVPPWLLLLRVAAVALLVLGLAQPVLLDRPALVGATAARGTLLLAIDNGWAASADWPARLAAADDALDQAAHAGRPVSLLLTAPDRAGAPPAPTSPAGAAGLRARLDAETPLPWPTDRDAAARALADARLSGDVLYVADGLAGPSDGAFARTLAAVGPVEEKRGTAPLVLPERPVVTDGSLRVPLKLLPAGTPRRLVLRGETASGSVLAQQQVAVPAGAGRAVAVLTLPSELRNQLSRLSVGPEAGAGMGAGGVAGGAAGGVRLLDEGDRRRPVGLLATGGADTPLLGSAFFLRRALAPLAELREGTLDVLLARPLSVLVAPDGTLGDAASRRRVAAWVRGGGMLIRFAGPRLAAETAADAGTGAGTDAGPGTDPGAGPGTDLSTAPGAGTVPDPGTDPGPGTGAGPGPGTGPDPGTGAGPGPGTDAVTNAGTPAGTNAGAPAATPGDAAAGAASDATPAGPVPPVPPADRLLPVPLLGGARQLGGAMSWSRPERPAPFAADTPFADLPVPAEVLVSRQVLAEPDASLGAHVWARLGDGTPLVTHAALGGGQLVLFHVTSTADWSNLPLSGLFPSMLQRLVARAAGVDMQGDRTELAPAEMLAWDGQLAPPPPAARALRAELFGRTPASATHPAGLYGPPDGRRALNLADALPPLQPERPVGRLLDLSGHSDRHPIGAALLAGGLALLCADLLATLALRGLLPLPPTRRLRAASGGLGVLLLAPLLVARPLRAAADPVATAPPATAPLATAQVVTAQAATAQVATTQNATIRATTTQAPAHVASAPIASARVATTRVATTRVATAQAASASLAAGPRTATLADSDPVATTVPASAPAAAPASDDDAADAPGSGATAPAASAVDAPLAPGPALETRLAYVVTGDAATDAISRQGLDGLSRYANARTSARLGTPDGVVPGRDDLAFYPLLYWPVTPQTVRATPDPAWQAALNGFMARGGILMIDTQGLPEGSGDQTGGGYVPVVPGTGRALRLATAGLDVPPLAVLPPNHVLDRTFYLLHGMPGRYAGAPVWAAGAEDNGNDGVSPVLIGGNDWAAAWAADPSGSFPYATIPGGEEQRTEAYRFGVNAVIYALTGNYKSDQVHVPALLRRLGQGAAIDPDAATDGPGAP